MTRFVLVPGAGGVGWYWHRVAALLGDAAVAVDLPGDDPAAGLPEYTDLIAAAADAPVVLVAQSMGAFSALPAVARLDVRRLVLLNAMIPLPGETPGEWWAATGWPERDFDLERDFLHDVPAEIAAAGAPHQRPEADIAFGQPCAFERWPDVPTTVLAGRDDRFFPLGFQRRVARERLGLDVQPVPGGHLAALSRPGEVAAAITAPG